MAIRLVSTFALALGVAGTPADVAPTSAPTVAPTSAPTTLPDDMNDTVLPDRPDPPVRPRPDGPGMDIPEIDGEFLQLVTCLMTCPELQEYIVKVQEAQVKMMGDMMPDMGFNGSTRPSDFNGSMLPPGFNLSDLNLSDVNVSDMISNLANLTGNVSARRLDANSNASNVRNATQNVTDMLKNMTGFDKNMTGFDRNMTDDLWDMMDDEDLKDMMDDKDLKDMMEGMSGPMKGMMKLMSGEVQCGIVSTCLQKDDGLAQPLCTAAQRGAIISDGLEGECKDLEMEKWWLGGDEEDPTPTPPASNDTTATEEPVAAPVSVFTATIGVENAADFDQDAYIASMASIGGVDTENVVIESIDFVIKVTYTFADDLTSEEIQKGAASMAGVDESKVEVTLKRRLASEGSRRLQGVEADVAIKTDDPAAAETIKTKSADPAEMVSGIATATDKTIAVPSVTPPAMEVEVVTKVISETAEAVELPSGDAFAAQLATKMEAETGKTFTVAVSDVVVETTTTTVVNVVSSSTTAGGDSEDEASGATKLKFVGGAAMLAALLALAQ